MARGRHEKYPYDLWLDGQPHMLKEGTDYPASLGRDHFIRAIRSGAARHGKRLTVEYMYLGPKRVLIRASQD